MFYSIFPYEVEHSWILCSVYYPGSSPWQKLPTVAATPKMLQPQSRCCRAGRAQSPHQGQIAIEVATMWPWQEEGGRSDKHWNSQEWVVRMDRRGMIVGRLVRQKGHDCRGWSWRGNRCLDVVLWWRGGWHPVMFAMCRILLCACSGGPYTDEQKKILRNLQQTKEGLKTSVKSWIMVLGTLKWNRIFLEGFSHLGRKDRVAGCVGGNLQSSVLLCSRSVHFNEGSIFALFYMICLGLEDWKSL